MFAKKEAAARRNLYLMYSVSFLQGMVFYSPVATLYRQARGLTLGQMAVTESVYALLCLALELPWGMAADRIGYRRTLVLCSGLFFVSKVVFWRADGFGLFFLERVLLAVTVAGLSGVDSSVIYLCSPQGQSQRAFGVYSACGTAGMVFAAVFYTVCIGTNYNLAGFSTAVSYGLAALLTLGLTEVRAPDAGRRQTVRGFLTLLGQTVRQRRFFAAVVGCALYQEAAHMVTVFLNQPQYIRCGWSVQGVGWAFLAVNAVSMASVSSHGVTRRIGAGRLAAGVFGLSALGCAALALTDSGALSLACILLLAAASGLLSPLVSELQNRQVVTADRATQLSIYAIFSDLTMSGADWFLYTAAGRSLPGAFWLCALFCLAGGVPLLCWLRKQR